jgi:hypothetical protein
MDTFTIRYFEHPITGECMIEETTTNGSLIVRLVDEE